MLNIKCCREVRSKKNEKHLLNYLAWRLVGYMDVNSSGEGGQAFRGTANVKWKGGAASVGDVF